MRSFRAAARLLASEVSRTRVLFYLSPVDYETGERLFGERFDRAMVHNIEIIQKSLGAEGLAALDLTKHVPGSEFVWHAVTASAPDGHLSGAGKGRVIRELARVLNCR